MALDGKIKNSLNKIKNKLRNIAINFNEGDVIEVYEIKEVKRSLA